MSDRKDTEIEWQDKTQKARIERTDKRGKEINERFEKLKEKYENVNWEREQWLAGNRFIYSSSGIVALNPLGWGHAFYTAGSNLNSNADWD